MLFLTVMLSIVAYIAVGFLSTMLYVHNCRGVVDGEEVVLLIFWPVTLLPLISYWFFVRREKKKKSVYSKGQRKEIASLKHQIEKAKLEAELEDVTTARLERMR